MEKITSLQNKQVKEWNALHQKKVRDQTNRFLIEGEHLIQEALQAGIVETILFDTYNPFSFEHGISVSKEVLKKLSQRDSSADLIAVCRRLDTPITKKERVLLLDDVQDPGNLGTLIRSAASFSYDGIYLSEGCCDLYNDKVIRSTQGALFHIPVERTNLEALIPSLKQEGIYVIGTSLKDAKPMQEIAWETKMAFVLGNEGQGVKDQLLDMCDVHMRIEMQGFESLNVAVAGGIIMYHYQ